MCSLTQTSRRLCCNRIAKAEMFSGFIVPLRLDIILGAHPLVLFMTLTFRPRRLKQTGNKIKYNTLVWQHR